MSAIGTCFGCVKENDVGIGARFGVVKENDICVSQFLSYGVRFFLVNVKLFRIVLAGDFDLENVSFLKVGLRIG